MDVTAYHRLADETLQAIAEMLEPVDATGALELEQHGSVLEIALPDGKQFVINKHEPTRQIWLSSPASGAAHFVWDETTQHWLAQGKELFATLRADIFALAGIEVE